MSYWQARNGDAFPLTVPQLERHGSRVYYLQAWSGDVVLLKVMQLERHCPSHGWQDGLLLLEKQLVHLNGDVASVVGEFEWPGVSKVGQQELND